MRDAHSFAKLNRTPRFGVTAAVVVALGAAGASALGAPAPVPVTASSWPALSARPVVRAVPDRAFFTIPQDLRVAGQKPEPVGANMEVPRLCDNPLRDHPTATARRAQRTTYVGAGWVTQMISAHRYDGAAQVMREVRADLASCDTVEDGALTITIRTESAPRYGDESVQVLEQVSSSSDYGRPRWEIRAMVIRVGDIITVVMTGDYDDERTAVADLRRFAPLAVETIEEWR